jgi:hypothetical protein
MSVAQSTPESCRAQSEHIAIRGVPKKEKYIQ